MIYQLRTNPRKDTPINMGWYDENVCKQLKSLEIYMVNRFKALRKIAVINWRKDQSFS